MFVLLLLVCGDSGVFGWLWVICCVIDDLCLSFFVLLIVGWVDYDLCLLAGLLFALFLIWGVYLIVVFDCCNSGILASSLGLILLFDVAYGCYLLGLICALLAELFLHLLLRFVDVGVVGICFV